MDDPERLPGARDVRVSLDGEDNDRVVVALPPHPQMGGDRRDSRLRAISEELTDAAVDCLRIDYGPWDGGEGERTDAITALEWATDRYEQVGLFGYSFGASIALLAGGELEPDQEPVAISALAPSATVGNDLDVEGALDSIAVPVQVVYGERDGTVDWGPVVDRAGELGWAVESVPADHFFVGQTTAVANRIAAFFVDRFA